MRIVPTVRCRRMAASIAFFTEVLDSAYVDGDGGGDPSFSVLVREGEPLFLSSHGGDARVLRRRPRWQHAPVHAGLPSVELVNRILTGRHP